MAPYNPVPRTLWDLASSGLGQTLTVSGNSGTTLIDLLDVTDVWLSVFVASASSGTSPTLDVGLDLQDPDGNWFTSVVKITQITTGPGKGTATAGLHMPNVSTTSAALALPRYCRIAWTIGGTASPAFPQTSICLTGR